MEIQFLRSYTVQAVDGPTYEAGQRIDLPEPSAMHFITRGVAEEVVESLVLGPEDLTSTTDEDALED